ncbi:hypothetical protein [Streptomyces sp. 891-h]|uniref:hypothetical protein n=1 Tax=Streptomyces sp. 891-h TaxID=2720714 RepID=UPI001FA97CCA|nr:hypothetical protein [Streptomyces sp. 891-h]UNZ20606.1 hypothetical protein HC362_29620 [Streptomyces sp. 891-h]
MKVRNSNDVFLSKEERETQISNVRGLIDEARREGDGTRERNLEQRLDHLLDNYAQEQQVRRGR